MGFWHLAILTVATRQRSMTLLASLMICLSGCQIADRFHSDLRNPVAPGEPQRTFTVTGEVNHPGVFEFPQWRSVSLQKAVAMAGGFGTPALSVAAQKTEGMGTVWSHSEYVNSLAVCIRRGDITYVIPAECVDQTELGGIHLVNDDIMSVVRWRSLLRNTAPQSGSGYPIAANGMVADSVRIANISVDEASAASRKYFELGTDTPPFLPEARLVRLTRTITDEGFPRVFLLPIVNAADMAEGDKPNWLSLSLQPGDTLTYLPAGGDPLLLASRVAEAELEAVLSEMQETEARSRWSVGRW